MKTKLATVALLLVIPLAAHADNHRQQQYVYNAFAIPVAVPVSPYAPFAYSSSQMQQQAYQAPPRSAEDILAERLATKIGARLGIPLQSEQQIAAARPTQFSQSCAKCHEPRSAE